MAVDVFETRTMLSMLEQLYPPKTFLLDTFFSAVELSNTEHIDIDIFKGKRRLAPFVRYESQAKDVERVGFIKNSFKPPYIKIKMRSTAADLISRMPGQTIYQGISSPAERGAQLMAKDLAEMQDMITRREEWMAAQELETGKVAIAGEGYDAEVDFQMPGAHQVLLIGPELWTDAASSPIDDLREWFDLIGKDSGLNADTIVLGSSAAAAFLNNAAVQKTLDNRRIEVGQIDPKTLPSGAVFMGTLKDPPCDIYRYNEYYFDEGTGTNKPMVPVDKIFMGSTKARTARHYGLIRDLEAEIQASVRWFPKSWIEKDPSVRWVMLQSAPLVCMHQPDAFLSAKVV